MFCCSTVVITIDLIVVTMIELTTVSMTVLFSITMIEPIVVGIIKLIVVTMIELTVETVIKLTVVTMIELTVVTVIELTVVTLIELTIVTMIELTVDTLIELIIVILIELITLAMIELTVVSMNVPLFRIRLTNVNILGLNMIYSRNTIIDVPFTFNENLCMPSTPSQIWIVTKPEKWLDTWRQNAFETNYLLKIRDGHRYGYALAPNHPSQRLEGCLFAEVQ